jgi:hypothetical protein
MTTMRCLLGMHDWRSATDPDDHTKVIECGRCGLREAAPDKQPVGTGWFGWRKDS